MTRSVPAVPPRKPVSRGTLDRERRTIVRALHLASNPRKHFDLQGYLGSPIPALGVYERDLRAIARACRDRHPQLNERELHTLARMLWRGATFEERILGCQLLGLYSRKWTQATWTLAARWVDTAEGWGLCDTLSGGVIARLLEQRSSRFTEVLHWSRSPNRWRRRAALYAMGPWVRSGHLDRPFMVLRRLYRDPEFWVRRAVGTWLRECWKVDRHRTERFLVAHARELSALTISVATERASRAFRTRLRSMARPSGRARTGSEAPAAKEQ